MAAGTPYLGNGETPREEAPRHVLAHRHDWPWFPTSRRGLLMPHPYCAECGQVQSTGGLKGLDLGGLVNVLGRLDTQMRDHGLRITEAQRRLITMKLKSLGIDDRFGLSRDTQMRMLAGVVADVLRMQPSVVESYMHSG